MKRLYKEAKWHEILYVLILDGLIAMIYVLFYIDGKLQELDRGQWIVLGWLTILCMLATGMIIWIIHSRLKTTGNYYFNQLSPEIQRLFVENFKIYRSCSLKVYLKGTFDNKERFIKQAFVWKKTKQGQEFWEKIAES